MDDRLISVFGSSAPLPGSADYQNARDVGYLLAQSGFGVATGGYGGVMAAVSEGAAAAGGRVVGITSDNIEAFRGNAPNQWLTEEVRYASLRDRVTHLVTQNAGMIVMPGGIGTLSELMFAWSLIQIGELTPRPLLICGEMWLQTMNAFVRPEYVNQRHYALLQYADSPADAVRSIVDYYATGD